MENIQLTTNLNVRVSKEIKETSEKIFENLGLNMSVAINMFLRQVIMTNGIPFEVKSNIPNKETLKAMMEAIELSKSSSKGYDNLDDLKKALGL